MSRYRSRSRILPNLFAILALGAILTGCGVSSGASGAGTATISGVVMAGPTCGAEPAGSPGACAPRPVPNRTVNIISISSAATITTGQFPTGPIVASATTDAQGHFDVRVPPGQYVAIAPPTGTGAFMRQTNIPRVTVAAGQTATVTINLDTGIR